MYTYVPPPEPDMFKIASDSFYGEFNKEAIPGGRLLRRLLGGARESLGIAGKEVGRAARTGAGEARRLLGEGRKAVRGVKDLPGKYRSTNFAKRRELKRETRGLENPLSRGERKNLARAQKNRANRLAKEQEGRDLDEALAAARAQRPIAERKAVAEYMGPPKKAPTPKKQPAAKAKPETEVPAAATAAPAATKAPTEVPEVTKPPTESPKITPSGGTNPPSGSTNPPDLPDTPEVPGLWNTTKNWVKSNPVPSAAIGAGAAGLYLGSRQKQQPAPTTATMMMR